MVTAFFRGVIRTGRPHIILSAALLLLSLSAGGSTVAATTTVIFDKVVEVGGWPQSYAQYICQFPKNLIEVFYSVGGMAGVIHGRYVGSDGKIVSSASGDGWHLVQCPTSDQPAVGVAIDGLYSSSDGVRWNVIFRPKREQIDAGAMIGGQIFLATREGSLLVNDGRKWQRRRLPVKGRVYQVKFSSTQTGVVWISPYYDPATHRRDSDQGYWTRDGGKSWEPVHISESSRYRNFVVKQVVFTDWKKGIGLAHYELAEGGESKMGLVVTSDSGQSWQLISSGTPIVDPFAFITAFSDQYVLIRNRGFYLVESDGSAFSPLTLKTMNLEEEALSGCCSAVSVQGTTVFGFAEDNVSWRVFVGRITD